MSGCQGRWSAHRGSEHLVLPSILLISRAVSVLLQKVKPIAKQEKSKPEKKENNGKKFQKEHQKKLKFTYKEQKEFETIDDDIAKLEEKIEQLDEEIMENATNSGKLAELTQQKEETEEVLNEKMDRWVYLNDLAEQIANQ